MRLIRSLVVGCAVLVEFRYFLAGRGLRVQQVSARRPLQATPIAVLVEALSTQRSPASCEVPKRPRDGARRGRFTGHEIDGFQLGNVIGRGGMGEVYAAERVVGGEAVAIKLLRLDALGEHDVLLHFKREAKIVASISSPHVVRVYSVSGDGAVFPYIAMERLCGEDLASHLRDKGKLALPEVLQMVEQLALGLDAAHRARVVHRDLKPSNVFRELAADGTPHWKILDFGISTLLGSTLDATATGLLGTPQYMSPEQVAGDHRLDQRADLYALSAIAYRALTGEPPFAGEIPSILRSVTERMPAAPSALVAVHHDLELALAIGLAKHREHRFGTALELAEAFRCAACGTLPAHLRAHARHLLEVYPYASSRRVA